MGYGHKRQAGHQDGQTTTTADAAMTARSGPQARTGLGTASYAVPVHDDGNARQVKRNGNDDADMSSVDIVEYGFVGP